MQPSALSSVDITHAHCHIKSVFTECTCKFHTQKRQGIKQMVLSRIIQRAQRIYTNKREMPNNLHRTNIIRKRSYKIKGKNDTIQ